MNRPPTEIETRQLEELMHAVDDLRRRVAALECQSLAAPAIAPSPREFDGPPADLSTGVLGALGRLLLGIVGAYLLRAITEAALLPQLAGTLAGLLCQRVASVRGQYSYRESSDRHLPRPRRRAHRSSIALGSHCSIQFALTRRRRRRDRVVLGQVHAWRRDLSVIAGVASVAGAATGMVLIVATLNPVPFAIALLIAAAAIE